MSTNLTNVSYKVNAEIHKLSINKNITFDCKILWRRNDNKTQTAIKKHKDGITIFNQTITLTFNIPYDSTNQTYSEKNTQLSVIIINNDQVKSGGVAKFNVSDLMNNNEDNQKKIIKLSKCPDPNAYLEITFSYQKVKSQKQSDEISIYGETNDLSISRIDFNDDKSSIEIQRINQTIKKIQQFTDNAFKKNKSNLKNTEKLQQLQIKLNKLEKENQQLKNNVNELEDSLLNKNNELKDEKKKHNKEIQTIKAQLSSQKNKENQPKLKKTEDSQSENYKQLYQKTMQQLQEIKQKSFMKGTMDIGKAFGGMDDIRDMACFSANGSEEGDNKVEELTKVNSQLQSQLASISHKMAQLFNASYDYGGARLLDYLQTSIGLTEQQ